MNNKMKEVAELLGVEFEKPFKIEGYEWDYRINQKGLYNNDCSHYSDEMLVNLLRGSEKVKMPENKIKMVILARPRGCNASWLLQKFKESQMASPSPIIVMDGINPNDDNKNTLEVKSESTNGISKSCSTCYYDVDWDNNQCVDCLDRSKWRPREISKRESPAYSGPVPPQRK